MSVGGEPNDEPPTWRDALPAPVDGALATAHGAVGAGPLRAGCTARHPTTVLRPLMHRASARPWRGDVPCARCRGDRRTGWR
jgi:hypothetical protein